MRTRTTFVGCILIFLAENVCCQMGGMMSMMTAIPNMVNGVRESQARAQLTPIVKYVVGDTAIPSPEMVNFAVIAGSAPVTQTEKDAYLDMMKKVARRTPEVLIKFIKNHNGTFKIDEMALDSHITQRAMQYSAASGAKKERKRLAEEKKRQQELEMIRMKQDHEVKLMEVMGPNMNSINTGIMGTGGGGADLGLFGTDPFMTPDPALGTDPFMNPDPVLGTDPFMNADPAPLNNNANGPWTSSDTSQSLTEPTNPAPTGNNQPQLVLKPGISENFSLLDMFRMHEQTIKNQAGGQRLAESRVNPIPDHNPTAHAAMMPTRNDNLMSMMFNGGFNGLGLHV